MVVELSPAVEVSAVVELEVVLESGFSPEIAVWVAEPEAEPSVDVPVWVAEPQAPEPEVVVLAGFPEIVALAAEPEVVFEAGLPEVVSAVAEPEVVVLAEPEAVFVAVAPQVSADTAAAFLVLVPVSLVVVEVGSSQHPRFPVFPIFGFFANCSSSVELVGQESVRNPSDVHTNHGLCSILSNPGLHQNRKWEHSYNNANPDYNDVIDTNGLPRNATTSHSRKRDLHQYRDQHTHMCQVSRSILVVRQMVWEVADQY